MKFTRLIVLIGILIMISPGLAGCATAKAPSPESPPKVSANELAIRVKEKPSELATVTEVVNGDIIEVLFEDGRIERVRYIGINTLENSVWHVGHGTWACRLLVGGKQVKLVKDQSDRDEQGNLLRYVFVGNIFVNARLLEDGHSSAMDDPPNTTYASEFAEIEAEAKTHGMGCWVQMPDSSEEPASN